MKLTIFLTLVCVQLSAAGISQTVTLSVREEPLESVFKKIEKQTGYYFFYKTDLLKESKLVTLQVSKVTLKEALDQCFENQPLTYIISEKGIFVKRKELAKTLDISSLLKINGRVVDDSGQPVLGVVVTLKRTNESVLTNANGEFSFDGVDENDILMFSNVAYERQEIKIGDRRSVFIMLVKKVNELDQTVVIGYGQTTKRFNTGNIGSVKAKDIERQPVNNPLLAMQGRVPGLMITQNTGVPGGGVTVRIQGQNSISASNGNDPLYIIDGVPYVSQMLSTTIGGMHGGPGLLAGSGGPAGSGNGNPLSYINPADIESIDVLKDADATAIYGSRAANGAILITTKKGKIGRPGISLRLQQGWGKVPRRVKMLNTQQFLEMRREAFKNDGVSIPSIITTPTDNNYDVNGHWDTLRYTNWQKVLIGKTANYTDINGTVSGGTSTFQYLVGASYHRETTVFPGDFNDTKGNVHFSLTSTSPNQKFKFQLSGNYMMDMNRLPGNDLTADAIRLAPNAPTLYNADGTLNWAPNSLGTSSWQNPLGFIHASYENLTSNLVSSATLSYVLFPGLEVKSSMGFTNMQTDEFQGVSNLYWAPEIRNASTRMSYHSNSNIRSWIIEPQLSYKRQISKGRLELLLGNSLQQRNGKGIFLTGLNYNNDNLLRDIRSASTIEVTNSTASVYKYTAVFGRVNYNWDNRYIINLTARRDGSSRFGSNNQFHNFGAIGLAWIFSEEKFINSGLQFLSFGKLRASYGTTGNDQIPDYSFLNLYQSINPGNPYQGTTGLRPSGLANPYLQWEKTQKLQVGIDLGFAKDRILLTANYVRNRSSNQLLGYDLPMMTGFSSVTNNYPAIVKNIAWEFSVNTINIRTKSFSWNTSFNLTLPENELVSFPGLEYSTQANRVIVGQPLGIIKVYRYAGVDPATGQYQFWDTQGNLTFNPPATEATGLISLLPKWYGGFQNSIEYANFQLDFLIQFVNQVKLDFFTGLVPGNFSLGSNNHPIDVLTRWQKPGDITDVQRFARGSALSTAMSKYSSSDKVYIDGSFVRLKNIALSYQLAGKGKQGKNSSTIYRLFAQAQNVFTITKYKGLDPENSMLVLPPLRVITAGLQVNF